MSRLERQRPRARRKSGTRGFTLIELMLVVSILGILAVLSFRYATPDRERQFQSASRAIISAVAAARGNALATGTNSCVSIDNGVIVAYVDVDHNKAYGGSDKLLFRYPDAAGKTLPTDMALTSFTMREMGSGPQTAVYDARGFYIDSFTGFSVHDANVCLQDNQLGRSVNVQLSRFGWAGLTNLAACGDQPVCPH